MANAAKNFALDPDFGQEGRVVCDETLLGDLAANSIYSMAVRADGSLVLASSDQARQGHG